MDSNEMKERTKQFALRVINLIDVIPQTTTGRVISNQLVRCATSVGANYRASLRGRSKKEFIAKLGICLEEADESCYWLELTEESGLIPADRLTSLRKEADELCAIIFTMQRSARKNDQ